MTARLSSVFVFVIVSSSFVVRRSRRRRARENDPGENRTDQQLLNRDGVKEGLGNGNGDEQGTGVKELEMNSICAVERGGP